MSGSINCVGSIEALMGNTLTIEVIRNNFGEKLLQFFNLNKDNKNVTYMKFDDYNTKMKELLKKNNTFYIKFCGINNTDTTVPDYLYLVFSGNEVQYRGLINDKNDIFLEFKFKKGGLTLENELQQIFTNNVGVFVEIFY